MKAKISEVFKSIQGEGPYQGFVQVFVRFFGCNLSCDFCDTKLKRWTEESIESLLEKIFVLDTCHSVSLTGGEPLLQLDFLKELAIELKNKGKTVYLETNGILYRNLEKIIDYVDIIAMDFKLPSSTAAKVFWQMHKEFLKIALKKEVFVKAVVNSSTELSDIIESIKIIKELKPDLCFVLQPQNPFEYFLGGKLKELEDICLKENINVKVIRQLHKELGVK